MPTLRPRAAPALSAAYDLPYMTSRIHRLGGIRLGVTNYGLIGGMGTGIDTCLGQFEGPVFEFPAGSGLDYLWGGALDRCRSR